MPSLFSRLFFGFLLFLLMISAAATAQELTPSDPNAPITIEADRMESRQQDNLVLFTGNVEAVQGEITINAAEMTVTYVATGAHKKDGAVSRQIEKLHARGNVKIIKGDLTATGAALDFFASESKVVLTGGAKAWQGKNIVTGNRIVLYLNEGRSIVDRGEKETSSRVTATIFPAGADQKEK